MRKKNRTPPANLTPAEFPACGGLTVGEIARGVGALRATSEEALAGVPTPLNRAPEVMIVIMFAALRMRVRRMVGGIENKRTGNDDPGIKRDVMKLKNQDHASKENVQVVAVGIGDVAKK